MPQTYKAILNRDRIEWLGPAPETTSPIEVEVTVPDAPPVPEEHQGAKLARLFEELSRLDPFREIDDPVAWQREIRKDRPLPGREPAYPRLRTFLAAATQPIHVSSAS
jgi:hypothetical protein